MGVLFFILTPPYANPFVDIPNVSVLIWQTMRSEQRLDARWQLGEVGQQIGATGADIHQMGPDLVS
jgi:hypothetical protein